ncbi:DEAD/DEAH box helicase [Mesoplasma seiffertii]|uniref:DEAD/DEAH box helicase n=1 Tax=Mesoplasma seiffertii TaxID=28224 RepID=UPI000688B924|nr:DEAD/DEAH box helicase [Mesoplasma seiffertii]
MTFKELQLNEHILKALEINKFDQPTEIQEKAIPVFLNNQNLFGKSSTGTGKTAAFVLPILHNLTVKLRRPQVIILAPTRELALQIVDQVRKFSSRINGIGVAPLIGGAQMRDQINRLRDAQIIVGTPGRVNDHLNRGTLKLNDLRTIILDEADEMLKMGFKNEIDAVFKAAPEGVQVGLFSATNTPKVMQIANNYMKDYELVEIHNELKVNSNITNTFIFTKGIDKEELILKVFEKHAPQRAIVFTNTKSQTDKIARNLKTIGVKAVVINGDKRQSQRTKSIKMFKNDEYQVLVATDVVARGIDISGVDYVINYDISRENEHFVHRIGRTGRNNETGNSISFIANQGTLRQIQDIEKTYKIIIDEMGHEEYGVTKTQRSERSSGSRDSSFGRNRSNSSSRSNGGSSRSGRGNYSSANKPGARKTSNASTSRKRDDSANSGTGAFSNKPYKDRNKESRASGFKKSEKANYGKNKKSSGINWN